MAGPAPPAASVMHKIEADDMRESLDEARWEWEGGHPDNQKVGISGGMPGDRLQASSSSPKDDPSASSEAGRWESEGGPSHPRAVKDEEEIITSDPHLKEAAEKGAKLSSTQVVAPSSSSSTSSSADSSPSEATGKRRLSWSERVKEKVVGLFAKSK